MASEKKKLCAQLESVKTDLHRHFESKTKELTKELESIANELDKAYRPIKQVKEIGLTEEVMGGTLQTVGFGLSFCTFGSSLALCVIGGVIGGLGGVSVGAAKLVEFFKENTARSQTKEMLDKHNQSILELLNQCQDISNSLSSYGNLDDAFPSWASFWGNLVVGSGKTVKAISWDIVRNTIKCILQSQQGLRDAEDVTVAVETVISTLGATAKKLHVAGGVVGAFFLPLDIYSLIVNSTELYNETAHRDSDRIREIVQELNDKCPKVKEIDDMIDKTLHIIDPNIFS